MNECKGFLCYINDKLREMYLIVMIIMSHWKNTIGVIICFNVFMHKYKFLFLSFEFGVKYDLDGHI